MVRTMEKAQVSLPGDTQVRVTRDFAAPRKLVWQAHTDPKLVKRWMLGPPGWRPAKLQSPNSPSP